MALNIGKLHGRMASLKSATPLRPSHRVTLLDRPAFFELGQTHGEFATSDGNQRAPLGFGKAEPTTDEPCRVVHDHVVGP